MPGRSFNPGDYPNGYNGQRMVDEIAGVGNHYTAEFWEYDPRARLRWNMDPEFMQYPGESPYVINHNNPIQYSDPKGDSPVEGDGDGGDCVTCPKPKPEENLAGKDNLSGFAPLPPKSLAMNGGPQTFVSANNDTPAVAQMKSDNANYLANGGTGGNLFEKVAYQAGQGLAAMNELPATVTLPMVALTGGTSSLLRIGAAAETEASIITVGRWMAKSEYEIMATTGQMVEGAGGQTFVSVGGSNAFKAAAKGSVYAEFGVSSKSLLQGGQANWFKAIGPNAKASQLHLLQKQGGNVLPPIQNLSPILKVK